MNAAFFHAQPDPAMLASDFAAWREAWPECGVLALLAEADQASLPMLQTVAREREMPLVGAIFPALLHDGDFVRQGVWLLRLERMPVHALIADLNQGEAPAERIHAALQDVLSDGSAPTTLMLLFDSMLANIASILEALYQRLADRVQYMGANAGSETFTAMPCLFDANQVVSNGVLCLLLPDAHGAALEHGYRPPDELISATATEGNRIISIDWRPAFEVYRERVQALFGVALTHDNFYQYGVHFPFGILLANGEVVVRIPVSLEQDGSLFCVGEVPANSMLTLLDAPAVDSCHTIQQLVRNLDEQFGACGERDLLTFYCAGRRLHLSDASQPELHDLLLRSGCSRVIGALSLGEIGSLRSGGYPVFHNATLVCRPW